MTSRITLTAASLLLLALCSLAPSADKPSEPSVQAVNAVFKSLAAAYSARDAQALAELFTATGEFIDAEDNVFQGRKAIAAEFGVLFERNPKHSVTLAARDVREISSGLLTVDGTATMSVPDVAETVEIEFVALIVRQTDGRWLLASLRSSGEVEEPGPRGRLRQLAWLVGDWVDESRESTMQTHTRWSEDGHFLLTEFTIHVGGQKAMTGTQRIGWDGSLEKFRSWVFDSDGGHAEGLWTAVEGRWVVQAKGVRPDGAVASATQTYSPQGRDAFVFSVTDRIVAGEELPGFMSRVVRQPPAPQPQAAPADTPRRK